MATPTKRITDLTTAGTIDGTEEIPIWKAATRKVTVATLFSDLGIDLTELKGAVRRDYAARLYARGAFR